MEERIFFCLTLVPYVAECPVLYDGRCINVNVILYQRLHAVSRLEHDVSVYSQFCRIIC